MEPAEDGRELSLIDRLTLAEGRIKKIGKQMKAQSNLYKEYQDNIQETINTGELARRVDSLEDETRKIGKLDKDCRAALEEMREMKDTMQTDLNKQKDAFTAVNTLCRDRDSLTAQCAKHETDLSQIKDYQRTLRNFGNENREAIEEANATIESLRAEIATLKASHAADLSELRSEFMRLLEDKKMEILDILQPTVDKAASFDDRIKRTENEMRAYTDDAVRADSAKHTESFREVNEKIGNLDRSRNRQNEVMDERVTAIEGQLRDEICPNVSNLQTGLKQAETAINATNNLMENEIRTLISNNTAKIDGHIEQTARGMADANKKFDIQEATNRETAENIRSVRETAETNKEDIMSHIKGQINSVMAEIEHNHHECDERSANIEKSVAELDQKQTKDIAVLRAKTKKRFLVTSALNGKCMDGLDNLFNEVSIQAGMLETMRTNVESFKEQIASDQRSFVDNIEHASQTMDQNLQAAKQTMLNRCNIIEEEMKTAKEDIRANETEIVNRFAEIKSELEQATGAMNSDMKHFKEEVRRINAEIKEQNESAKANIVETNTRQFDLMEERMTDLTKKVNDFVGSDGLSIQSVAESCRNVSEALKNLETEVKGQLDDFDEKINEEITKHAADLQTFKENTTTQLNIRQLDATTRFDNELHSLDTKITDLTEEIHTKLGSSETSAAELQVDVQLEIRKIKENLEEMKNNHASEVEGINTHVSDVADSISSLKKELDDAKETVELNRQLAMEQAKAAKSSLDQSSKDLSDSIDKGRAEIDEQLELLRGRVKELNDGLTQNKTDDLKDREDITNITNRLEHLSGSVEKRFESMDQTTREFVDRHLGEVQGSVTEIKRLFDVLKGDSDVDFPKLMNNMEVLSKEVNETLDDLDEAIKEVRTELIGKINNVTTETQTANLTIRADFDAWRQRLDKNLTSEIGSMKDNVRLEFSELFKRLSELKNRYERHVSGSTTTVPEIMDLISELRSTGTELINTTNREAESRDKRMENSITLLNNQLTETIASLDVLSNKLNVRTDDELQKMRSSLMKIVEDLSGRVDVVEEEIAPFTVLGEGGLSGICKSMSQLEAGTSKSLERVGTEIREMNEQTSLELEKLRNQITSILGGSELSINELNNYLTAHRQELDDLQQKHVTLKRDVDTTLQKDNDENDAKFKELGEKLVSFDDKCSLEFSSVKASITTLMQDTERTVGNLRTCIDQQKEELLEKGKKRKQSILSKVNGTLEDHMTLIDEHTEKLVNLQSDVSDLGKKTDEYSKTARGELRKEITELETKTRELVTKSAEDAETEIKKLRDVVDKNKETTDAALQANEKTMNEGIANLSTQLDTMRGPKDVSISTIATELDTVKSTATARFGELEKSVNEIDKKLTTSISTVKSKTNKAVGNLSLEIGSVKKDIKKMDDELQKSTKAGMTELEASIRKLDEKARKAVKETNEFICSQMDRVFLQIENNKQESDTLISALATNVERLSTTVDMNQNKNADDLQRVSNQCNAATLNEITAVKETLGIIKTELMDKLENSSLASRTKSEKIAIQINEIKTTVAETERTLSDSINRVEGEVKGMIGDATVEHKNAENEIRHHLSVLEGVMTAHKNSLTEMSKKETQDVSALDAELGKTKNAFQSIIDELSASVKSHIEKRKSEIKTLDAAVHKELVEVKTSVTSLSNSTDEKVSALKQNIVSEAGKIREEMSDMGNKQQNMNDEMKNSIHDIDVNISCAMMGRIETIEARQTEYEKQLDVRDNNIREVHEELSHRQNEFEESISKLGSTIEQVDKLMDIKLNTEVEKLRDKHNSTDKTISGIIDNAENLRGSLESSQGDIKRLERVHFYNKEMEQFEMRFEEVLAYMDKFRSTICEIVTPSFLDKAVPNGDAGFTSAVRSIKPIEAPERPRASEFTISKLANDTEIGILIHNALSSNATVIVKVPEGTRVIWNRYCHIRPHQTVRIFGANKSSSVIQMKGVESFGEVKDPTRAIIDGYGTLEMQNIRVEAKCGSTDGEQDDLCALFMVRGWSAVGPSVIDIDEFTIDSDRNLINVAGNGFAQIHLSGGRISNSKSDDTVCPVVAVSGPYPSGSASVLAEEVKLTGNGIEWSTSKHITMNSQDE